MAGIVCARLAVPDKQAELLLLLLLAPLLNNLLPESYWLCTAISSMLSLLGGQVERRLRPAPLDVHIILNPLDETIQFRALSIVMDRIAGGDGTGPPSDPACCKAFRGSGIEWPLVLRFVVVW